MRRLTYFIATTIDGFIATSDGDTGFFPWEGDHGPAITAEFPESLPAHVRAAIGFDPPNRRFGTVLMGRRTYEAGLADGVASPYPHQRQIVVSTTMTESPDPAVEIAGDAVGAVRTLKREPGADIWICGGGALAHRLLDEIDELVLKVYPIVLGAGVPLFAGAAHLARFTLADCRPFDDGVVLMTYTSTPPEAHRD